MSKMVWRVGSAEELAQLLRDSVLEESAAVSGNTVYRLQMGTQEKIAIALANGQALIIEPDAMGLPRRRRLEADNSGPMPLSDDRFSA